jgi:hypothetical protein
MLGASQPSSAHAAEATLIHRSAWNWNSRKSTCRLLHSPSLTFLYPLTAGAYSFFYVCLSALQRRVYIRRRGPELLCERQRRAGRIQECGASRPLCVREMMARKKEGRR